MSHLKVPIQQLHLLCACLVSFPLYALSSCGTGGKYTLPNYQTGDTVVAGYTPGFYGNTPPKPFSPGSTDCLWIYEAPDGYVLNFRPNEGKWDVGKPPNQLNVYDGVVSAPQYLISSCRGEVKCMSVVTSGRYMRVQLSRQNAGNGFWFWVEIAKNSAQKTAAPSSKLQLFAKIAIIAILVAILIAICVKF